MFMGRDNDATAAACSLLWARAALQMLRMVETNCSRLWCKRESGSCSSVMPTYTPAATATVLRVRAW
jgi:hypothetical protein